MATLIKENGLNRQKIEQLVMSFELVRIHKEAFAAAFYDRLFLQYPQVRLLFQGVDMKQQEKSLVGALATVVSMLKHSEMDQFTSVVQSLGSRHKGYGVQWEHYWMVGNVLLSTLADFFEEDWTFALNDAWADAYQAIVKLMDPIPHYSAAKEEPVAILV